MTETKTGLGVSYKRKEDPRLLTGYGRFTDDIELKGMLHLAILRSPHAHAYIRNIDTSQAQKLPGVVAVLTGEESLKYTGRLQRRLIYSIKFRRYIRLRTGRSALSVRPLL